MADRFRIAGRRWWKKESRTRHEQWHVSGWAAVALAPFVILAMPFAILFNIILLILGHRATADLTAEDVRSYLSDFLEGRGEEWDWDDFTSIALSDPELDAIRMEADSVPLPLDAEGRAKLVSLLKRLDRH